MGLFLLNTTIFRKKSQQLANSHDATATLLEGLVAPVVASHDAYLIDISVRGERGGKVVEIFLDSDTGLSTGTCAAVSRELSELFDKRDVIPGKYHLVVSSPGIDRPLKFPRQYGKHIGRNVRVEYISDGVKKSVAGALATVGEETIGVRVNKEEIIVRFEEIVETKVLPAW